MWPCSALWLAALLADLLQRSLAGRAPRGLIARVGALDGRGPPNLVGPRGPQIADVLLASLGDSCVVAM